MSGNIDKSSVPSKLIIVSTGTAGLLLLVGFILAAAESIHHGRIQSTAFLAPDFVADAQHGPGVADFTLKDSNGRDVSLHQFSDVDVLVVNVWSAGCPVCREEIPSLTALDQKLSQMSNVALLTVAVANDWNEVSAYFPQGTNLRILFDPNDQVAGGVFKTEAYPETFILDKKRRIRARFDGPRAWHLDSFINYIRDVTAIP